MSSIATAAEVARAPGKGSLADYSQKNGQDAEDDDEDDEAELPKGVRKKVDFNPPVPVVTAEERQRRFTTPSKLVSSEDWYVNGKSIFVAKCSGCHPSGGNLSKRNHMLINEDFVRNGISVPDDIIKYTRYGKGSMPGFAKDCSKVMGYDKCGVITQLPDVGIADVTDFVVNRANDDWKGRG